VKLLEGQCAAHLVGAALLAGCSPSGPVTVTMDGSLFATLESDGWHHVSGELLLPAHGRYIGVGEPLEYYPVAAVVDCEGSGCKSIVSDHGFEVRGAEVWRAGTKRGDITNASSNERLQVAVLMAIGEPPVPVTVTLSADLNQRHAEFHISAMPSGELVRNLSCQWPEQCLAPQDVVGSWTEETVTINQTTFPLRNALIPTEGGWRFESKQRRRSVRVNREGQILPTSDSVWWRRFVFEGAVGGEWDRVDVSTPAAGAAFFATITEFEEWWMNAPVLPPPPPPPPRRDP
jgi:hypothetical protein